MIAIWIFFILLTALVFLMFSGLLRHETRIDRLERIILKMSQLESMKKELEDIRADKKCSDCAGQCEQKAQNSSLAEARSDPSSLG